MSILQLQNTFVFLDKTLEADNELFKENDGEKNWKKTPISLAIVFVWCFSILLYHRGFFFILPHECMFE
jgi:hypothetical protein